MPPAADPGPWTVPADAAGDTVAAFVRARTGEPWSQVKRWIERGKIAIDGQVVARVDHRLAAGAVVALALAAPRPRDPAREAVIVFDDPHVVVIDKPAGVSSVPFEDREGGTAMDLIRGAWRRMGRAATVTPLHVVHRIDRGTSGLLMFAKSKRAELGLAAQLRAHTCERSYRCVAHGEVRAGRIESRLVADRGDGLRGSARHANQGKRAVTHVAVVEALRGATACEVTLETGKTHQIRIHLAERGHPLVGETVYIRDLLRDGGQPIAAARLMLHAATLGFAHPITGEALRFRAPLPPDFEAIAARLRR
ncbi:MAG: RluA family pseudouridine synthase [Kofleriaceae bacterium]|nr:RluA family pseudouridine synthase [Myxococcales bacterium]MCB9560210.1 RluA family pseudouridine synthase [Kofleriaceae bacterium]MCB9571227.1 RluA family pseudouridine synthase [Kofleriaceae bacterium]